MQCQWCGFEVTNPAATVCPNCGSSLTQAADQGGWQPLSAASDQPPGTPQPGMMPPAGAEPPTVAGVPWNVPAYPASGATPGTPGMPPYGWPAPPSMPYGQPGYGPPAAPSTPLGAPAPGYGQPAPPNAPYGAPPTYPMPYGAPYPGYPTGSPFPGYPMGGAPPGPPPAPPKRHVGLIVGGSVAAVLLLLVVTAGALFAFVPPLRTLVTSAIVSAPTTSPATPTATATPAETVLYQNTFASAASDWANDTHCSLGSGGYHVKDGYVCYAPIGQQSDVDVTVDAKQVSGATNQPYGIAIRLNDSTGARYEFDVDGIGHWVLLRCDGQSCDRLVDYTASAAIHGGLNTSNTLEVRAKGTHFDFFANGTKIGQVDDTTYASGLVGLSGAENGECVFANLTIAAP